MARYRIQNYNAFLRASKREYGISHKEAQELYRQVKPDIGRPPRAVDVTRHPVVVKRHVKEAQRVSAQKEAAKHEEILEVDIDEWSITFDYS